MDGSRSGLFFEIIRLTREIRPRYIFLENVPAITLRGLDRILLEFTALGYDCRWTIVSAAEMGACHIRERWFLLAHARSLGLGDESKPQSECKRSSEPGYVGKENSNAASVGRGQGWTESITSRSGSPDQSRGAPSDATSQGRQRWFDAKEAWQVFARGGGGGGGAWPSWLPQPSLCRGSDGLSHRVDRLRGLGNAVCPQAAREAFERLMGLK